MSQSDQNDTVWDISNTECSLETQSAQIINSIATVELEEQPMGYTIYCYDVKTEKCFGVVSGISFKSATRYLDVLNSCNVNIENGKLKKSRRSKVTLERTKYFFGHQWIASYHIFSSPSFPKSRVILLPSIPGMQKQFRVKVNDQEIVVTSDVPKYAMGEDQTENVRLVTDFNGNTRRLIFDKPNTVPGHWDTLVHKPVFISDVSQIEEEKKVLQDHKSLKRVFEDITRNRDGRYTNKFSEWGLFTLFAKRVLNDIRELANTVD